MKGLERETALLGKRQSELLGKRRSAPPAGASGRNERTGHTRLAGRTGRKWAEKGA